MEYNHDLTHAKMQEAIEKAFTESNYKQERLIVYGGRGGNNLFYNAIDEYLKKKLKDFEIQFRSQSGELVTITYEKYNNLKQETKDIIDKYRVR